MADPTILLSTSIELVRNALFGVAEILLVVRFVYLEFTTMWVRSHGVRADRRRGKKAAPQRRRRKSKK